MTLWAIVPVKPLQRGKSRLAAALDPAERAGLNRVLLERTIRTLMDSEEVEEVLVVSRDSSHWHWPETWAPEQSRRRRAILNTAAAAPPLRRRYASRVPGIPADLLCVLADAASAQRHQPGCVIAPIGTAEDECPPLAPADSSNMTWRQLLRATASAPALEPGLRSSGCPLGLDPTCRMTGAVRHSQAGPGRPPRQPDATTVALHHLPRPNRPALARWCFIRCAAPEM
jgi:hypothetical protein